MRGEGPNQSRFIERKRGVAGEVWDLRRDTDKAFERLESQVDDRYVSWAATPRFAGAGTSWLGGFYDFASSDDNFSPAINFATANQGSGSHFFVVTGAIPAGDVTITVTGTSITDEAVRTESDTDTIVIPAGTPVNSYFETPKKWNGQVSIEATGTPIVCNYGLSKYWDNWNRAFKVTGLEALWEAGANDSSANIILYHHKETGWTFNSGSTPTPPAPIASRNIDYGVEDNNVAGEDGAWKRTNLDVDIAGADSEGIVIAVVQTVNRGFDFCNFQLRFDNLYP
jgi:hypothetical protein